MSEKAEDTSPEHTIAEPLAMVVARQMGRLAEMATDAAQGVGIEPTGVVVGRLKAVRDLITDVLTTLHETDEQPATLPRPLRHGPRPLAPLTSGPPPSGERPGNPFYRSILPGGEFRKIEPWNPAHAIRFYIISDHHIYCPETGRVCMLEGDTLFVFNAFLKDLQTPRPVYAQRAWGFHHSPNEQATRERLRSNIRMLERLLATIVPDGFGNAIVTEGHSPLIQRMLDPDIVVEDKRDSGEYDHLVPPPQEVPEPVVRPAYECLTVTQIANAAGASPSSIRGALKAVLGDDYDAARADPTGFRLQPALAAMARIKRARQRPKEGLPPGHIRVATLVDATNTLGLPIDTAGVLDALQAAGISPARIDAAGAPSPDGVWAATEEGALAAIFAAQNKEPAEPADAGPDAPPDPPGADTPVEASAASPSSTPTSPPTPPPAPSPTEAPPLDPNLTPVSSPVPTPAPDPSPAEVPTPSPAATEARPDTTPPSEEEIELKASGNTLADIAAVLNATTPPRSKPYTVDELQSVPTEPDLMAAIDPVSFNTGLYSHYAARKIIAKAQEKRGAT